MAKYPLILSIEIAGASLAILSHVDGTEDRSIFPKVESEADFFCGSSLIKARMGIAPMLLALSMELALKAWIVRDQTIKSVPKSHDLLALFRKTSPATQQRLIAGYERECVFPSQIGLMMQCGFEYLLESARHAFVQWRYMHELQTARFNTSEFIAAIQMTLAEFESEIVVRKYRPPLTMTR
jgi:hypothetical protein